MFKILHYLSNHENFHCTISARRLITLKIAQHKKKYIAQVLRLLFSVTKTRHNYIKQFL